jgi:hypothetical protein
MKRLALIVTLAALAAPAAAQFPPQTMTSTQLGPFTYHNGTDANGNAWNGTTSQLGPFGYTNFNDSSGRSVNCTSTRLGQFTTTNCN